MPPSLRPSPIPFPLQVNSKKAKEKRNYGDRERGKGGKADDEWIKGRGWVDSMDERMQGEGLRVGGGRHGMERGGRQGTIASKVRGKGRSRIVIREAGEERPGNEG